MMRRSLIPSLLALGLCPGALAASDLNGPDYVPPFEIREAGRVDAELRVASFLGKAPDSQPLQAASLVFGNKRVAVREFGGNTMESGRDNRVTILVNESPVLTLILVANYRTAEGTSVSLTDSDDLERVALEIDDAAKQIRWSSRYPLPDGSETEFSYTLAPAGESKVRLSWDFGCSEAAMREFRDAGSEIGNLLLYGDISGDYRKDGVTVNGEPLVPKPEADLKSHEGEHLTLWEGILDSFVFAPERPLYGVSLQADPGLKANFREIFHYRRIDFGFQSSAEGAKGSVVIDLGEVAAPDRETPPAVEGQDHWAQDALHLPKSPTRNLFPNPSFDQGMRYWRWWDGGATYSRSDLLRYDVDPEVGLFGHRSLVINPVQRGSLPLRSFSLPSQKGTTYTVSFYAKAEDEGARMKLAPLSSKRGGQFDRDTVGKHPTVDLGAEWKRYSYSFVSDGSPISFILSVPSGQGKVWVDGLQYEAGDEATEFIAPPLEGELLTSHPEGNVEAGAAIDARFQVRGNLDAEGTVTFSLEDFYKNAVWIETYSTKVGEELSLPFDELDLGTGVYFLQARFEAPGSEPYSDYYRFTIIDSLDGTHATKDLYGALFQLEFSRMEERMDLMRRLGFGGSSSYGAGKLAAPLLYELREKYNITDYTHEVTSCPHLTAEQKRDRHPDYLFAMAINTRIWRRPEERKAIEEFDVYSDEVLAKFEDLCERVARECPYVRVWAIATEEEITIPALRDRYDFDEFAKLQAAFYRGIKKGNPDAIALPSGGTSGYGKVRGKKDIEGFLGATQDTVKWDAIAIHPYGSIDGTLGAEDLDEAIQMLKDSIAQFGYGDETPILLNEGGGISANLWGDGPGYSYTGGQPSYDQGLTEFLHAAKLARVYIMCLKYWPQVPHFNTWQMENRTVVDCNLSPTSFLLGINTLGHLLGEPEFVGDIRPASGVRGYAFKDKEDRGVAAVWCTIDDVERGFTRGPVMQVKFDGAMPELVDLMGRTQSLKAGPDGMVDIQLTPAPLFLRGENPETLAKALQDAEILGAGSSVEVAFLPTVSGAIQTEFTNRTGREQEGTLVVGDTTIPFGVAAKGTERVEISKPDALEFGRMFRWNKDYVVEQPNAKPQPGRWEMDYFYVPKVEGMPDWEAIPAISMTNQYRPVVNMTQTPGGKAGDQAATFQAAWDDEHFYLRVEAEDDVFNVDEKTFWSSEVNRKSQLYMLDGCLEVSFDCGANGRLRNEGFDLDDYRYDFSAGNAEGASGKGLVYRFHEVFNEYAGGVEFPTKEEAAEGIACEFSRISETRYAYTITFDRKYVAPMRLEKGGIAGFGLYLHDRMDDGTMGNKGLSLATEAGGHCDRNPQLWPLMILTE